ncbi:MAG: hypothetical protein E2592_01175 [Methylobacillus sp.]|nr:hypothetical protein [Methylobacillus sp.]
MFDTGLEILVVQGIDCILQVPECGSFGHADNELTFSFVPERDVESMAIIEDGTLLQGGIGIGALSHIAGQPSNADYIITRGRIIVRRCIHNGVIGNVDLCRGGPAWRISAARRIVSGVSSELVDSSAG